MKASGFPSGQEDRDLLAEIAGGSRPALSRMYDRYADMLLAVGVRMMGRRSEAEDVLQDVFVEIWQKAGDYDARRSSVLSWAFLRMRSRCLDRMKRGRSDRTAAAAASYEPQAATEDPTLAPDKARVRRALVGLPSDQRTALQLAYFDGLSGTEIADRLRAPLVTIKTRIALGISKLRRALEEAGDP